MLRQTKYAIERQFEVMKSSRTKKQATDIQKDIKQIYPEKI